MSDETDKADDVFTRMERVCDRLEGLNDRRANIALMCCLALFILWCLVVWKVATIEIRLEANPTINFDTPMTDAQLQDARIRDREGLPPRQENN